MNAPAATARDGAFLARVLADALSLGLPDPDYITMHPCFASLAGVSAVDFQFNDRGGQDPLPAMQAWADRFGAAIRADVKPGKTWHEVNFTYSGVLFHAYAAITAPAACGDVASYSRRECALPAGHDGRHESADRPAIVWEGAPAEEPAASYKPGADASLWDAKQAPPVPLSEGPCMTAHCGHGVALHALALSTGDRLHCVTPGCKCNRYLSPRPGGLTDDEWRARRADAPAGFVTADGPVLRGARIGGEA